MRKFLSAKSLASLIGKIISMSLTFGPIARFMTRNLYDLLNSRRSWYHHSRYQTLEITAQAGTELQLWLSNMHKYNRQNIWPCPAAVRLVYSDASSMEYSTPMPVVQNTVDNCRTWSTNITWIVV